MEQSLVTAIEQMYNCRVTRLRARHTVWHCETNRGTWIIKGYDDFPQAAWVTRLATLLHERGFTNVIRYVPTIQNVPVFKWNDRYMTAMEYMPGRNGSYFHRTDIIRAIQTLAHFHLFSSNIPYGPPPEIGIPLLTKWEKRLEDFQNVCTRLENQELPRTRLTQLVQLNASPIQEEANYVLMIARNSLLTQDYKEALRDQRISHKDLASHNFLIHNEHTSLIDFDTAGYDTPIVDLVQLLNRALVLQYWDMDVFEQAISAYRAIRPLTEQQVALIFLLIRFPDNFLREVNGVYDSGLNPHISRVEYYVSILLKGKKRRASFFSGYERFLYQASR